MPSKWLRSGDTLIEMPWKVTHLRDTHADGGDFVFAGWTLVAPVHPDADAALAELRLDIVRGQRVDHPAFQLLNQGTDSRPRSRRSSIT